MPITIPRRVVRFNRAINNPIQRQYAWLLPPWAIICHTGRRSGRLYRTPVNAYKRGNTLAIVVLYGEESDWVRNVLAGQSQVVRGGRTYGLIDPRVVSVSDAKDISLAAKAFGRAFGKVLVAPLGDPNPGFGRGPST